MPLLARIRQLAVTGHINVLGTDSSASRQTGGGALLESIADVREDRRDSLVSVNMIQTQLLDDSKSALIRGIANALGQNPLDLAFTAWLTPEVASHFVRGRTIEEIVATEKRSYRQTATLGILARTESLGDAAVAVLASDLEQLFGRDPVVSGTPMPFCMDGMALAGIMLGMHAIQNSAVNLRAAEWLSRCAKVTAEGNGLEEWQEWLLRLVGEHSSIKWHGHRPWSPIASIVSVALMSKGIGLAKAIETEESDEEEALKAIQTISCGELPLGHSVLRLAALNRIRRIRPVANLRAASAEDLVRVLRRLPDGLQHWTWEDKPRTKTSPEARKWHLDNEYHVQNLLWLLLAPIFPDLVSEDYTPKVGPVQPRADIGLPSLRIIVEAKFMRSTDAPKSMIEQIAEDASLYLVPSSKYDRIIPFIWDDSRRSERHEEMLRGLRQIRGVVDAVIVSRPGSMIDRESERD